MKYALYAFLFAVVYVPVRAGIRALRKRIETKKKRAKRCKRRL